MPTKISLLPFKLQGATEYSILTLTPLPKKILPVTVNTINVNRYIFLQKWQNHFLYFTFWGVNVLLLTLSWKTLLKFFFLKNIILPFLTPKRRWAASSSCFIIHRGYVDCSGLSQHYKITYPLLLTVNKCHLL